jgi:hypothetical protein
MPERGGDLMRRDRPCNRGGLLLSLTMKEGERSMRRLLISMALISLPCVCIASGQTGSFRCSNGIVSIGDTLEEVVSKCGPPSQKKFTEISPLTGSAAYRERNTHRVESHWTYDPGPDGFVYKLEFRDGKVRYIENTEKYGSR